MVAGVKLRRVMSSIMRRRKGVMCGSFASERGRSVEPVHDAATEQRRGISGGKGEAKRRVEQVSGERRPEPSGSSFLPTAKRFSSTGGKRGHCSQEGNGEGNGDIARFLRSLGNLGGKRGHCSIFA